MCYLIGAEFGECRGRCEHSRVPYPLGG